MILKVRATDQLKGTLVLPASKSYSIRAFIVASRGGHSTIIDPSNCDDALVAKQVAEALGAKVRLIKRNRFDLRASESSRITNNNNINVKESGTVLRFLLPLLSSRPDRAVVKGEGTLRGRPNFHLLQALRKMGVDIRGQGSSETVPIAKNHGRLSGGKITIDGSLSSQFISAFLIACPTLPQKSTLAIIGKKLVSSTYITMTQQILKKSGIKIIQRNPRLFFIQGNQKFKGLKNFVVPSDFGLAAFFMVAAALVKADVILKGHLKGDMVQSDAKIFIFLRQMRLKIHLLMGIAILLLT